MQVVGELAKEIHLWHSQPSGYASFHTLTVDVALPGANHSVHTYLHFTQDYNQGSHGAAAGVRGFTPTGGQYIDGGPNPEGWRGAVLRNIQFVRFEAAVVRGVARAAMFVLRWQ